MTINLTSDKFNLTKNTASRNNRVSFERGCSSYVGTIQSSLFRYESSVEELHNYFGGEKIYQSRTGLTMAGWIQKDTRVYIFPEVHPNEPINMVNKPKEFAIFVCNNLLYLIKGEQIIVGAADYDSVKELLSVYFEDDYNLCQTVKIPFIRPLLESNGTLERGEAEFNIKFTKSLEYGDSGEIIKSDLKKIRRLLKNVVLYQTSVEYVLGEDSDYKIPYAKSPHQIPWLGQIHDVWETTLSKDRFVRVKFGDCMNIVDSFDYRGLKEYAGSKGFIFPLKDRQNFVVRGFESRKQSYIAQAWVQCGPDKTWFEYEWELTQDSFLRYEIGINSWAKLEHSLRRKAQEKYVIWARGSKRNALAKHLACLDELPEAYHNTTVSIQHSLDIGNCEFGTQEFMSSIGLSPSTQEIDLYSLWRKAKASDKHKNGLFLSVVAQSLLSAGVELPELKCGVYEPYDYYSEEDEDF